MDNPWSVFDTNTTHLLLVIVVPGLLVALPWAYILGLWFAPLTRLSRDKPQWFVLAVILAALPTGMVLEDLGATMEVYAFDQWQPDAKQHAENWWLYLRTAYSHEPVGERYLRTVVLRFKFELSFIPALLIAGPSWFYYVWRLRTASRHPPDRRFWRICILVFVVFPLLLAGYLFVEAHDSSRLLGQIRAELLKGVRSP